MRSTEATIIAARETVGAETPLGRRLSMLNEQLKNGVPTSDTLFEIGQLRADGGEYVHENHFAIFR